MRALYTFLCRIVFSVCSSYDSHHLIMKHSAVLLFEPEWYTSCGRSECVD